MRRGEYGDVVHLPAYTGLRCGERAALRVRRVDFLRKRLTVAEGATEVGSVVRDRGHLQYLKKDLHLSAARADAGGGVLREPGDDLLGGALLSDVVRSGDVQVQRGRQ